MVFRMEIPRWPHEWRVARKLALANLLYDIERSTHTVSFQTIRSQSHEYKLKSSVCTANQLCTIAANEYIGSKYQPQ